MHRGASLSGITRLPYSLSVFSFCLASCPFCAGLNRAKCFLGLNLTAQGLEKCVELLNSHFLAKSTTQMFVSYPVACRCVSQICPTKNYLLSDSCPGFLAKYLLPCFFVPSGKYHQERMMPDFALICCANDKT